MSTCSTKPAIASAGQGALCEACGEAAAVAAAALAAAGVTRRSILNPVPRIDHLLEQLPARLNAQPAQEDRRAAKAAALHWPS